MHQNMWRIHHHSDSSLNGLQDYRPFLLRNVVLVHVNIIAKCVHIVVKHERGVHEWARVDKTTALLYNHLFDVENKTPVKDLESDGALATENHDFVVSNLVGQTHVTCYPFALVDQRSSDFLPDVTLDVIHFNSINNALLINTTTESEQVLVLEWAQSNASSGHSHVSNLLPFVLLSVVSFAVGINLVVDESTDNIDKPFNSAHTMVCVRIVHIGNSLESSEDFIVTTAILKIHVQSLNITSDKVNLSTFSSNWSRVQRYFILHSNHLLFEDTSLNLVDLGASLVPLEGMKSLWHLRTETILNVVINSQVSLHEIYKVTNDFVRILVQQSLKFAYIFIIIEILFKLTIQVSKDSEVLLKNLNKLANTHLLGKLCGLLQLLILVWEALIECR